MKQKYIRYSGNEEVAIHKRHLVDKVSVSDLCDEYQLNPTVFYRWQKDFFENGAATFEKSDARRQRGERKRLEELLRLNCLKLDSAIHPGQKLLVRSSRAKNLVVHQTPAILGIRILRQTDPFKKQEISKAPFSHLLKNFLCGTFNT
jgi:transposase-like protein